MVASAMGLVIMAAATAVFVSVQSMRSATEKQLAMTTAAATAFLVIQRDIQNAGFKFPSPLFAVRVLNAPASVKNDGTTSIDAAGGCPDGSGGLMPGSDVLEILIGDGDRTSGSVNSAPADGGAAIWSVLLANATPFMASDNTAVPRVLLYGSQARANRSCLGMSDVYAGGAVNVTMLDRDLLAVGNKAAVYPNCPAADMVAWMLSERIRYLVCKPAAAGGHPGLYRQDSLRPDGLFTGIAPTLVQEDIEDLQLAPRLNNSDAALDAKPDCQCVVAPGATGPGNHCYCGMVPGAAVTAVEPAAGTAIDETKFISRLTGLRVGLSASLVDNQSKGGNSTNPALFNRAAVVDPVGQPRVRTQQIQTVNLPNLAIVSM